MGLDGFGLKILKIKGVERVYRTVLDVMGRANGGYGWTRTTDLSIMSAAL
jgi:hypothetical protein